MGGGENFPSQNRRNKVALPRNGQTFLLYRETLNETGRGRRRTGRGGVFFSFEGKQTLTLEIHVYHAMAPFSTVNAIFLLFQGLSLSVTQIGSPARVHCS